MSFQPSPYQVAIYDAIEDTKAGSLMVDAVAGSGKTTTIVQALDRVSPSYSVLFLAFNKSIATELDHRTPRNVECRTFHSLGFRALKGILPGRVKVDSRKTWRVMDGEFSNAGGGIPSDDQFLYGGFVKRLVSLAKGVGVGSTFAMEPAEAIEAMEDLVLHHGMELKHREAKLSTAVQYAARVLFASFEVQSVVDFDDMLAMPVALGARFRPYDLIMVDEAQDTNQLQGELLARSMHERTRIVFVGDPRQAIYGFRGADASAMAALADRFDCTRLPLSVSYRCARAIVEEAQEDCPEIEPFEHAPEGHVEELDGYTLESFLTTDGIICRTNAPLVKLAYGFIGRGQGVRFLGRELGQGLLALVNKLGASTLDELDVALETWTRREIAKAEAKKNEAAALAVADKAQCLELVMDNLPEDGRTIAGLERAIADLFDEDKRGTLTTLCSVHKSKGLEWSRVFILDPELMPHPMARRPWQVEQEYNLRYVARTRAKTHLYYITSDRWGN